MTQDVIVHPGSDNGVVRWEQAPLIDTEYLRQMMDNYRAVRDTLLKPGVHFGTMPGVTKPFLLQPGAEVYYRGINCRPHYSIIDSVIDRVDDYCYFLVKAEVVSIGDGTVVGEAHGACSSLEFDARCDTTRPLTGDGDDLRIECPVHPQEWQGRRDWHWGDRKGEKVYHVACKGRNPQSLGRTLQNVQSRAQKRAMVAAIRTVGCISEMFSQDSELVGRGDGGRALSAPEETPAQRPASKSGQQANRDRQAPPPATPKPGNVTQSWADEAKAGFSAIVEAGVTAAELKGWAEDRGYLASGGKLTAGIIKKWAEANPEVNEVEGIPGFVNVVLTDLIGISLEDAFVEGQATVLPGGEDPV